MVMIDRTEEIFGHGITIAGLLGEGDLTIQRFAALAVADSPDIPTRSPACWRRTVNRSAC